jgi:hypothetical protein
MTFTLLLIAGVTIAILMAAVMVGRGYDVVQPALAGETTAVGLADPAAETLNGHNQNAREVQNDWHLATVPALHEAEEMLDYLEAQGYAERELVVMGNACFAIRWR